MFFQRLGKPGYDQVFYQASQIFIYIIGTTQGTPENAGSAGIS